MRSDNVTSVPVGGTVTDGIVIFKGTLTDPDANAVKLQVEVRPVGTAFTGTMTAESLFVASGSQASVQVTGLSGSQHWQARAVDSNGAGSAWTSFGGNAETSADFTATAGGGGPPPADDGIDHAAGDRPCHGAAGGTIPAMAGGLLAIALVAALLLPAAKERR